MTGPEGEELHDSLDRVIADARGRVFTGAALQVWRPEADRPKLEGYWGETGESGQPVRAATRFDLASLTKLFTATAALRLIAGGALRLDDRVTSVLSDFARDDARRDGVTVFHVLTHTSGLPPFHRLYETFDHPGPARPSSRHERGFAMLRQTSLQHPPGQHVVYSDVGFVVLGEIIGRVTGMPLEQAVTELVLQPLESTARYCPGTSDDVVATEVVPWRGHRAHGEVHDENAAVLGGVAGHAGLFGTALDVARLGLLYARGGDGLLPPELARAAMSEHARTRSERRGLGFKLRSPDPDAADHVFSPNAHGHYGFTGTALWIDPGRRLVVSFLTNRVYYGRDVDGILTTRRALFAAVCGWHDRHTRP